LVAVNGLGEEYVLGETAGAPALGSGRSIVVSPNVARNGDIQVTFRVASDLLGTDVTVFDASGRLVRRLASGVFPSGIRSVTWDGRDDRGESASAGVYFVRLAWGGQSRESARVTFVR
jgi:flagellar hook assembly protein FlgD